MELASLVAEGVVVATAVAADEAKAIDEKVRSLVTALAFFVAASVPVFFIGRAVPNLHPAILVWDDRTWSAANVFFVMFGFGISLAVMWAFFTLDPRSHRPVFLPEITSDDDLCTYKRARFRECQAFTVFALVSLELMAVTRLPDTDQNTRTWVILGSLILFLWVVLAPLMFAVSREASGSWLLVGCFALPALLGTGLLTLGIVRDGGRWAAVIYAVAWLLFARLFVYRGTRITIAVASLWLLAWLAMLAFAIV